MCAHAHGYSQLRSPVERTLNIISSSEEKGKAHSSKAFMATGSVAEASGAVEIEIRRMQSEKTSGQQPTCINEDDAAEA